MLKLQGVNLSYHDQQIVFDFDLQVSEGQFGCLLGPSGCGKTSVLRAIAGFEPIQAGEIRLRDNCVSSAGSLLAPERRNVGVVFQDFALFPHLTVAENIAFGLTDKLEGKHKRVADMLDLVGLNGLRDRYPYQLSGGQQQRVALARALAPKPNLLLLDEPFSSLDEDLRESLAKDLARIVRQQGITTLMVTHDQHEAFALADVIAVMHGGCVQQVGSAYELYHQPQNPFVADFIGDGIFIEGEFDQQGRLHTCLGDFDLDASQLASRKKVNVLIRPDDILHDDDSEFKAEVVARGFKGAHILYELRLSGGKGEKLLCLTPSHHDHAVGEQFGIRLDLKHLVCFEQALFEQT